MFTVLLFLSALYASALELIPVGSPEAPESVQTWHIKLCPEAPDVKDAFLYRGVGGRGGSGILIPDVMLVHPYHFDLYTCFLPLVVTHIKDGQLIYLVIQRVLDGDGDLTQLLRPHYLIHKSADANETKTVFLKDYVQDTEASLTGGVHTHNRGNEGSVASPSGVHSTGYVGEIEQAFLRSEIDNIRTYHILMADLSPVYSFMRNDLEGIGDITSLLTYLEHGMGLEAPETFFEDLTTDLSD